ncbi:hypothetical protein HDU77_010310 [Chytriomyces hyalinus]|nr:hypothetical protein HDU77_010310 [Chytriomyces hyalinus]
MAWDRLVDFFGGYLMKTEFGIHHGEGVVQLSKLGDERCPFYDGSSAVDPYKPKEIPSLPPATAELQPGDLAYATFTIDTKFQHKVQFHLHTVCKIGSSSLIV